VVSERSNGLNKIRIMPWNGKGEYYLPFENETYTAYVTTNVDFDTDVLRYGYQSMATPSSVIDFNMKTKERIVLKEQKVLGGKFDKNNYIEERIWATATDGTKIDFYGLSQRTQKGREQSVAIVCIRILRDFYGSVFFIHAIVAFGRGFIYAIAHIRGGEFGTPMV
jgi:oligopeptidase B